MDYIVTTKFMADGKDYKRGELVKGKVVAKWMNYQVLEAQGFIKRIENPNE